MRAIFASVAIACLLFVGCSTTTKNDSETFKATGAPSVDREAIRKVILKNLRPIRQCYEEQLNKNAELFGKIVMTWTIGEQGKVTSASTKSNGLKGTEGKVVGVCIAELIKHMEFPAPPTGQTVEVEAYPFTFSN
jgi:hypothetical protein